MYLLEVVPAEEDFVKRIQHTLTATELSNLLATPITILPAPGAGKRYAIFAAFAFGNFFTTVYTMNGVQFFYLANGGSAIFFLDVVPMLTTAADTVYSKAPDGATSDGVNAFNQPLKLHSLGPAEITLGDTEILLVIYYTLEGNT